MNPEIKNPDTKLDNVIRAISFLGDNGRLNFQAVPRTAISDAFWALVLELQAQGLVDFDHTGVWLTSQGQYRAMAISAHGLSQASVAS